MTTDVAPFARELFKAGAAAEITADRDDISENLVRVLLDESAWEQMRRSSSLLGDKYDWNSIFRDMDLPGITTNVEP